MLTSTRSIKGRRATAITVTLIAWAAFAGGTRPRVVAQEVPPPRVLDAANGRLFGCQTAAVRAGNLLRRYAGDVAYVDGGALPASAARGLVPHARTVSVLGPEGACTPRLGVMSFWHETGADPIVGQAMGGCGRRIASLALLDCAVPSWLRFRTLEALVENLPRAGAMGDPALEALAQRPMTFLAATQDETAAQRVTRLRRRVRRSTVRTEREEMRVLELHRFLEGAHPCEHAESVETSVEVRRVDRDPPGPWEALAPRGRVLGAYLDDAGWIVALDTVQSPREGHCEFSRADIGLTCDLLAVESRSGATLATRSIGYGMNWTSRAATSPLAHAHACRETGY